MTRAAPDLAHLDEVIDAALRRVYDPCSVAAGTPLNLVEMGLIRSWHLDPRTRRLEIVMVVTSPACFLSENMAAGIREQVRDLAGITEVAIEIDSEFKWSPDELSTDADARLREHRGARLERLQIRPRQWQEEGRG